MIRLWQTLKYSEHSDGESMGMGQTALILAVQPDSVQAVTLRYALRERVNGEVVVVHSTEAALSVIDTQVPDVMLLHALMLPAEEDHLLAYLRTRPHTDHVQAMTIPQLTSLSDCDCPQPSLLGGLKQRPARMGAVGCDSRLFAADVVGYLTRAREIQQQIHERKADDEPVRRSDRRCRTRREYRCRRWCAAAGPALRD